MNIESTFTVLRLEQPLMDHAPHSVQFESLTERLLRTFSAATTMSVGTAAVTRTGWPGKKSLLWSKW